MDGYHSIEDQFKFVGPEFLEDFRLNTVIRSYDAHTQIISEAQLVRYLPVVISGLVKVYSEKDERELLYYFLEPGQSCIITFASIFKDGHSTVYSCTEEKSELLLIPIQHLSRWIIQYPALNIYFYQNFELRYTEMMESVNKVIFYRLDRRVLDYLEYKIKLTGNNPVKVSHREIASSLGTAREVVSRILKKFEHEGCIRQSTAGIEVRKQL